MSTVLVFRRIARIEFDEAADWYERRQAGLGPRFVVAVQRVLDRIAEQPDFYPVVHGEVRESFVQRFPFCIYYREEAAQILVLAVFHTSRDPSIWQGRS